MFTLIDYKPNSLYEDSEIKITTGLDYPRLVCWLTLIFVEDSKERRKSSSEITILDDGRLIYDSNNANRFEPDYIIEAKEQCIRTIKSLDKHKDKIEEIKKAIHDRL